MQQLTQVSEIIVSYKPTFHTTDKILTSGDAYKIVRPFFNDDIIALQEMFVAMYLNRANCVLGVFKLSTGGITGTIADPRLILSTALQIAATGIVLAHNHPSGNLKPSAQDEVMTTRIQDACRLLEIKLLDHLILSPEYEYFSFADSGIL